MNVTDEKIAEKVPRFSFAFRFRFTLRIWPENQFNCLFYDLFAISLNIFSVNSQKVSA